MTVRKINVSRIEGNGSNADNINEVRPYGEIGLYEGDYIEATQQDRLELLIHDGVRTHLKSKVLSPGILYGSGADSGDGNGFDTIKLIPDSTMNYNDGSYGNDQYLIIDPTFPNHIHIRAGGTIDSSNAELFLGGELNHVMVSDSSNYVVVSTDTGEGGTNSWIFNGNGELTFPDTTVQTTAYQIVNPPESSTSTGVAGSIAYNATYFYVCTATNAWQRLAWDTNVW